MVAKRAAQLRTEHADSSEAKEFMKIALRSRGEKV